MKTAKLFLCALLALTTVALSAQNVKVSGTVRDAQSSEAIPFASVMVKGTTNGTATDADGVYSINAPAAGVLVFSSIGYESVEVNVGSRGKIDIALEPDSEFLDETIVVAYGTATKSSFTGSAAMVKSEAIEKKIATNVTSALAGTTPGVQMISSSGDPTGNSSSIRIRGIGSMSASNSPLIVVDGVPYEGAISDINPTDVESLSVLKDAAASAIYGHRGANGVVLITTKKGQSGEATVKFDGKWGVNSRLIPQYDVIDDPAQYYETWYKMMYNSYYYSGHSVAESYAYANKNLLDQNNGGLGYLVYTVPEGENLVGTNFKLNPNATLGYSDGEYYYTPDNWYNEAYHTGMRQEYNVSISGATDRFTYYASAGYLDDGGMVDNSEYKRFTGRVNAEYQVKPWFRMITNMSFSQSDSQVASYSSTFGSSGNIFYIVNNIAPIYPLYVRDAEGNIMYEGGRKVYDANQTNFTRPSFVGNAVRNNEQDDYNSVADVLTGKWGVVLTPVKGLTISANLGFTSDNTRGTYLYSQFGSSSGTDGAVDVTHSRMFTTNQQYLAEYKTDFGEYSNIDILAGYEQYNRKSQYLEGYNDHLFNPIVGELNNADGTKNKSLSSYTNRYMTQGFLARVQYDYDGKYFASASFRRDASSRFAKGHRWGNFWSVGGAWLMNKENFLKDVSWIDLLKLKVSYGMQGNDNLGSLYPYADQYTHSYNEETGAYSITLAYKGNEDLTWETSKSFNVGADFELFNGMVNGSFEVFARKTEDLLYSKDVPLSAGNPTGAIPVNVGSIMNKGYELTLDGSFIRTKNFDWTWNVNLSHYKNEILSLDESVAAEGIKGSNYIYKVGGSLYEAYMRKYAGVDKETGQALYYYDYTDEDGNTVTGTTATFSKATQYEIGSVLPKLYGGFGTGINAYGFDFSIQFSYQLGGRYYDGTYQALMHTQSSAGQAWHKDALKAWTPENTDTDVPRLDGDVQVAQTAVDRFMISSNYLSINNVTLGYTFPSKLTGKIKIAGLRIYVAGENLAVFSARKGVDPRYSMGLGSYTSGSGLNSGAYSTLRNITGGVTITF
jgi:TonB-linked SusC/RagA family outer membrane protein